MLQLATDAAALPEAIQEIHRLRGLIREALDAGGPVHAFGADLVERMEAAAARKQQ